ncbi:hypothetical protein JHD50_04010 [Sulfurimonas sp. MAG313]|nr:hypothetical protein [Sulfurimonas sp. MAG313]MDF1880475.1 hypothetical protein [Sulfurimonas sp. MAG313]
MKSMSIKEYAISNKLSIYKVIQMTKNKKLQTEVQKVDGKDEVFILIDEHKINEPSSNTENTEETGDYEKAYYKLKLQYNQLLHKYEKLLKKI